MKLIVLGSGTSVPHPKRTSSAYWIETDKATLLLDCGPSAAQRMAAEGLDWSGLDAIWISHFHLDHAGGLAPFLFGLKYASETQNRTNPLKIFGPIGLRQWFEHINSAGDYRLLEQPFPIEIHEIEPLERFQICEGLTGVSFDTPHTVESSAIHLKDSAGSTLVYSSDTGFTKALGSFAMDADVFLLECSFIKDKPVERHLELEEAILLARYSRAKTTILTHLYPVWDEVIFKSELESHDIDNEILEAFDGMRIDI